MQAGRELDALVAERVMGRRVTYTTVYSVGVEPEPAGDTPHYSTDIAAAWLVVEQLGRRGVSFDLVRSVEEQVWEVTLWPPPPDLAVSNDGDSAPLAICLAALALAGVPEVPA